MILKRAQESIVIFISLFFLFFLTYLTLELKLTIDFTSFYLSFREFLLAKNPFISHSLSFLSSSSPVAVNLNTPFFVMLFSPLSKLSYSNAYITWQMLSTVCLLVALKITFKQANISSNKYIYGFCFSYPILMNFFLGQIGSLIFLAVILGFDFLSKRKIAFAGFTWGVVTGIKLFPGLLLFYALREKQYKLCLFFCLTFLITILLPYFIYGASIYDSYFEALAHIKWYKQLWNASLLGFTSRVINVGAMAFLTLTITEYLTIFLHIAFFVSYLLLMWTSSQYIKVRGFHITIIYMILLSPLGWFYYFSLLIIPLSIQIKNFQQFSLVKKSLFILGIFLLMFPRNSNEFNEFTPLIELITIGSQYFYGLLLILLLTLFNDEMHIHPTLEPALFTAIKLLLFYFLYSMTAYVFLVNLSKLYIAHLS